MAYHPQKLAEKFCKDYKVFDYLLLCHLRRLAHANIGFRK